MEIYCDDAQSWVQLGGGMQRFPKMHHATGGCGTPGTVRERVIMRTATSNGVALEYETQGVGEPVALIHLSLYADSFAPLMDQPALAGYQLLRYHRRGYAGSSRTAGPVTITDQAADLARLL